MDVYILHTNDLKKAASGIERFDLHDKQLLLFSNPDEPPDPELLGRIENAFAKVESYECPLEEKELIFDRIKKGRQKEDVLYFIGPGLSKFAENMENDFLEAFSGVCISKTFNTANKKVYTKTKRRKTRNKSQEVAGQIELSELMTSIGMSKDTETSLNSFPDATKPEPGDIKPPCPAANIPPAGNPSAPKHSPKSGPKKKTQHKTLKKEEKQQKQVLDSIYKETEYQVPYSDVENAKAQLCDCLLDRIYQHITDFCFGGDRKSNSVEQEDTVNFIIILLRSYSIALEKAKEEQPEKPASQIDYGKLANETIALFESSWSALYSIVKLEKKSLETILPEAQFYWRLTKMLYEEDIWEHI